MSKRNRRLALQPALVDARTDEPWESSAEIETPYWDDEWIFLHPEFPLAAPGPVKPPCHETET